MPLVRYIGIEGLERAPAFEAAQILSSGGIIIYPTETLYGIGADATNDDAVRKINLIKERRRTDSQIVLIRWEWMSEFISDCETIFSIIESFLPGPLTIITNAIPGKVASILTPNGKIAFRISSSWFVDLMLEIFGKPITSTSVNISEKLPLTNGDEILSQFWDKVDGIFLFKGIVLDGLPSTIVDVSEFPERLAVIREGEISERAIRNALKDDV